MKLYRYLTGPDNDDFCHRVSEALNNGWELYGSPTLTYNGESAIAGQAIIKHVEKGNYSDQINLRDF